MSQHHGASYVLIAEHAYAAADRLCALVREEGLEPVVVTDGDAALEMIRTRGLPRILIVNPSLPRRDGFEVIRFLRERATSAEVAVLVTSGFLALRTRASQLRSVLGIHAVLSPRLEVGRMHELLGQALAATSPTASSPFGAGTGREERDAAAAEDPPLDDHADPRGLDAELETELEAIARDFGVSTALVTYVFHDRVYIKASHGAVGAMVTGCSMDRRDSLCTHVVTAQPPEPLVVPDATRHPVFSQNRLVRAGLVGSYVGVPLAMPSGRVFGTLCLIDTKPWQGVAEQVEELVARACIVTDLVRDRSALPGRPRRRVATSATEVFVGA